MMGAYPFWLCQVYCKAHGSSGRKVYHKPTHTNLYLNILNHHYSQNFAVLSPLVQRVKRVAESDCLESELEFLRIMFEKWLQPKRCELDSKRITTQETNK